MATLSVQRSPIAVLKTDLLPPTDLSLSVGGVDNRTVTLTWTDAEAIGSVKIYRALGLSGEFSQIASVAHGVETYDDTVVVDGTYYYKLKSFEIEFGYSVYSSTEHIATGA